MRERALRSRAVVEEVYGQWQNPSDILSLLLIIGPDIVQRAFAQLVGVPVAPVAFSFGWVAYSINALSAVFGDGHLMPASEGSALLINCEGHQRTNSSWVIDRLLHDFEHHAESQAPELLTLSIKEYSKQSNASSKGRTGALSSKVRTTDVESTRPPREALRITVFKIDTQKEAGKPTFDWVYGVGVLVILVQIAIAAIPWALSANYFPFIITTGGTVLVLLTSMLPQWGKEKYSHYKTGGWTVSLTRGNGSRHVMLILGKEHHQSGGLDLEVMATRSTRTVKSPVTQISVVLLAALSTILLITVAGMKDDTWYLIAIGTIGMIQNLIAASAKRSANALGIHLKPVAIFSEDRVASVLQKVEEKYTRVGLSLISVFFPGGMRVKAEEMKFWDHARSTGEGRDAIIYQE